MATPARTSDDTRLFDGRYRMFEPIGNGSRSIVYRACHAELGTLCAIKMLRRQAHASSGAHGDHDAAAARFRTEARALARIDHPNIVRLFEFGFDQTQGTWCLITELLFGTDLAELARSGIPMPWQRILRIGRDVALAVQHAHDRSVVHGDVRVGNVRIVRTRDDAGRWVERAKLLDFGIADLLDVPTVKPPPSRESGELAKQSPEQWVGEATTARSDIYALGALLYELSTGRSPFERGLSPQARLAALRHSPPSARSVRADIPESLERAIQASLSLAPEDRPSTARDIAVMLHQSLTPRHVSKSIRERGALLPSVTKPSVLMGDRPNPRAVAPTSKCLFDWALVTLALVELVTGFATLLLKSPHVTAKAEHRASPHLETSK